MALRGNLKDFTLPDVFQLIAVSKKTGVLRIKGRDDAEGSVWFRDGDVFFAQSNWHHEKLGDRLVAAQKITPSALARALQTRAVEPTGRRIGQILVDEGYITDSVLEAFVQEQIQDTVFDLMRWDDGEFDFEILPTVVDEDIGLTVSIENIIMEGSRRLEEWARIKKKVPSMDIVFRMATAPGEGTFEISLKPVEWNLLLLIDGTRSVSELARATGRTDFEVARIVYGLFSAGLLEVTPEDEALRLLAEREERAARRADITASLTVEAHLASSLLPVRSPAIWPPGMVGTEREAAFERPVETPEPTEASHIPAAGESLATAPAAPVEVPEFLSGAPIAPNPEDMAVFEEMVGALLERPEPELELAPEFELTPEPELEPEPEPKAELAPEFEIAERWQGHEPLLPGAGPDSALTEPLSSAPEEHGLLETLESENVEEVIGEPESPAAVFVEPAPLVEAYVEPAAEPRVPFSEKVEPREELGAGEYVEQPGAAAPVGDLPAVEPMSLLEEIVEEAGAALAPPIEVEPRIPSEEPLEAESLVIPEEVSGLEEVAPEREPTAESQPDLAEVDEVLEAELIAELGIGATHPREVSAEAVGPFDVSYQPSDEFVSVEAEAEAEAAMAPHKEAEASFDAGFAGAISDEISALTGVQRQRPATVVNSLEMGATTLRRDIAVDRETLLKIIDGIQNL